MKRIIFFVSLFIVFETNAQLKSPQEFLGYPIGSKYTPHWKIVSYFEAVAREVPTVVKLQQYGKTNEGRPLMIAFIASEENIKNLEQIRLNNLRLANLAKDKMAATEDAPAIVWLSYNVHGNETSSSEAAMLTLYALVDPANTKTKEWLKNTVVIIDPCINPDGRDRYVNWFNSIVGKNINVLPEAREHNEPWPGGRTNHYNFDLNRDWAWQTQIESRQRVKLYNQWMPQVHVDYHEQGSNNPYYFAPAAQPYHEVITPWQRDFQVTLGKNHARYFDKEGWLYYTKEVYDLFYPSYGDTYPAYNGAIGMTYEQGGGSRAGAGIITSNGDTLTLYDRAIHHFTTSLSTIETSSNNKTKLINEFRKFFNTAVNTGTGEYKTYIIKNNNVDIQRINSLLDLLDKNDINYEVASGNTKGIIKGFSYYNGKEENFSVDNGDVLVQSQQPRSTMIKVLFEPRSKLVDSNTYDITAWALPYAYGITAYASKNKITVPVGNRQQVQDINLQEAYGYVIKWQGVQSAKVLAALLDKGIKVRFSESPFETAGKKFERGSLIILKTSNTANWDNIKHIISEVCNNNGITAETVSSGFVDNGYDFGSRKVHFINKPKIALLTGEGTGSNATGEIWHFFEQQLNYPLTLVNLNDFSRFNISDYNVLIMTSGSYNFLNDKSSAEKLKNWISAGGKVVALETAVSQFASLDWGFKMKKKAEEEDDKKNDYEALKVYDDRDRDFLRSFTPGSIFKVDLDNTHPLAYGYPDYYFTLKQDDNMYEFIKEKGWNVGVIKKNNQVSGFVGSELKDKLVDGVVFGVQDIGRGNIVYLADDLLFRSFWENGKLMFCNAVFLVGQ